MAKKNPKQNNCTGLQLKLKYGLFPFCIYKMEPIHCLAVPVLSEILVKDSPHIQSLLQSADPACHVCDTLYM